MRCGISIDSFNLIRLYEAFRDMKVTLNSILLHLQKSSKIVKIFISL